MKTLINNKRGFTLVEIISVLTLMSVAMVFVFAVFGTPIKAAMRVEHDATAYTMETANDWQKVVDEGFGPKVDTAQLEKAEAQFKVTGGAETVNAAQLEADITTEEAAIDAASGLIAQFIDFVKSVGGFTDDAWNRLVAQVTNTYNTAIASL